MSPRFSCIANLDHNIRNEGHLGGHNIEVVVAGKPPPTDVEFEPLENGLDYLESVVAGLRGKPTPRDLKYAILHLAAAIEVLLKARLSAEHWTLIFTKVDSASPDALKSGNFQSVTTEVAVDRLQKIAGLTFDESDLRRIRDVVERRNKLQHHGLVDTTQALRSVAARALDFLLTFVDRQLRDHPDADVEAALDRIRDGLTDIHAFVRERRKTIAPELDASGVVVECPACGELALVVDDPNKCLFCLMESEPELAAKGYVENVLGQSEYLAAKARDSYDLYGCPTCHRETLVGGVKVRNEQPLDMHDPAPSYWCCFAEGAALTYSEISECARCGEKTVLAGDDGMPTCEDCWAEIAEYADRD